VTSSVEAILFDAYGTLFDVTSVREVVAELTPNASPFVAGWRTRQLEYSWLRTAMGRYVDFERVSADALDATALAASLELARPIASGCWQPGYVRRRFPRCRPRSPH
jgi:HAD superfamily hydrolase (TIGR01493 family)